MGSATTSYLYDVNAPLPVLLDDGSHKYVWGLGLALAVDQAGNPIVYHTDGLGSVRALTDSSGSVVQAYQYDEYGVVLSSQGSISQPFQYTGEQMDPETGLAYLRARMYDPQTGRLLQADPVRQGGQDGGAWNRYGYASANPASSTDPSGLRTYFVGGIGGSGDPVFRDFIKDLNRLGIRTMEPAVSAYDNGKGDWNSAAVVVRSVTGNDEDASRFAQRILKDLDRNRLEEGEQLNIIALSGGATTAFNAARYLGKSVPVDHLVTLGGVVFQGGKPSNVGEWIRFSGPLDPFSAMAPVPDRVEHLTGFTTHFDYIGTAPQRERVIRIMLALGVR